MLLEFIQTLWQAELDLTPVEIVETLLLARFLPETVPAPPKDWPLTNDLSSRVLTSTPTSSPVTQPTAAVWLTLQASSDRLPSISESKVSVLPFRSPRARALPGALKIARALRPLRIRHASSRRVEIDEEATVQQIADGGLKVIVWRPWPERWLTLELVLDESLSMHVWRPTLREFRRLLEQHGAFNNVNVWQLNADEPDPKLWFSAHRQRRAASAAKLLNPNVRQLVMVVSDCTAAAWHQGGAYQWLVEWAHQAATVLVQVLPRSLWIDTSMIETDVLLGSTQPCVPNRALQVVVHEDDQSYADWLRKGVALPVVTLDEAALAPWAKMVAGVNPQPVPGFVLPDMSELLTEPEGHRLNKKTDLDASVRVAGFGTASPLARELVRLLAAMPLSLPVMQLVQQVCLPQSRQSHLAEIFRSDLLNLPEPRFDQPFDDETIFDFHEGVRDVLLSELMHRQKEAEALNVLDAVEKFLADRSGQSRVFESLIVLPEGMPAPVNAVQVTPLALAFARIGARTLRKLNVRLDKAELWESFVQDYEISVPRSPRDRTVIPAPELSQQVYAFAPKGGPIELPKGATPVDFAYAIHTQVGDQCIGAKVNGRIVPLHYHIQNGDQVEILTSPSQHPSRDWLKSVVTTRARDRIKHFIAQRQREEAIEVGRKLFEKEASRLGLKLKKVLEDPQLEKFRTENGYPKLEDMYAAIGYGKLLSRAALTRFRPAEKLEDLDKAEPTRLQHMTQVVKRALKLGDDGITIKGVDNVLVYRAQCCNPIRGEEVIGYITRGKGVAVHARRCKNVANLMVNRERLVEVNWVSDRDNGPYAVTLAVRTEDRTGQLAALTNAIADAKTTIRDARTDNRETGDGIRLIEMTVEILDLNHLERVRSALRKVQGVLEVERVAPEF